MAITRKPKPASVPDEAAVQKLISKGGSVAASTPASEAASQYTSVLLRLPTDMLAEMDAAVKRRLPVRISRQAWIIEALQEHLAREG